MNNICKLPVLAFVSSVEEMISVGKIILEKLERYSKEVLIEKLVEALAENRGFKRKITDLEDEAHIEKVKLEYNKTAGYTTEEASKLCNGIKDMTKGIRDGFEANGDIYLGGGKFLPAEKKSKLVSIRNSDNKPYMIVDLYNIKSIFKIAPNAHAEVVLKNRYVLIYKDGEEDSIKIVVNGDTATFIAKLMVKEGLCL